MNYSEIVKILQLDEKKDLEAAKVIEKLLSEKKITTKTLKNLSNERVIIFGAGPSLKEDILKIKKTKLLKSLKIIAVDGAAKALLEEKIIPDIVVTDLDGDKRALMEASNLDAVMVVHAHGDNIPKLKEMVPQLKEVIPTTQIPPFGKLKNFGGFTDGDRAVFLAEKFQAKLIILAGMDFGSEVGKYSGQYSQEKKMKKLKIGKALIEDLAKNSDITILNLTAKGEHISNVPKISIKNLKILLESE